MAIKFNDIVYLFDMVNFGSPYDHQGYICKKTGKTYYYSDFSDNEEPLPDDIDDEDKYLAIPEKNDLDLGQRLVSDFALQYLPNQYDEVRAFFRRKGTYAKFKALLERAGKLDEWYEFEQTRTQQALREWCEDYGVELSD